MASSLLGPNQLLQRRKTRTSAWWSDYNAGCVYTNDSGFVDAICCCTCRVQRDRVALTEKPVLPDTPQAAGTPAVSERVPLGVNVKP